MTLISTEEYAAKLAAFEAKHGKIKRKLVKPRIKKLELSAELMFAQAWERAHNPTPMLREHKFHPTRGWRFDYAWPAHKLALEIDGRGRHDRVMGQREDFEKMNQAVLLGWRVLHVQAMQKKLAPEWVAMVREVLNASPKHQ